MPGRLDVLIDRLEAGEDISPADVDNVAALQSLDIVRQAESFLEEMLADERAADDQLAAILASI